MKEKMMKIAKSNITLGVLGGLACWGMATLADKITHNGYKEGFSDGVVAAKDAMEFTDKLQEAIDKQKAGE
jgi:exopolysaccharide biosynthesis protein